ncbi:MAG: hypothetical protein ACLFU5_04600 [Thermoplasmata archaeon]
MGMKVTFKEWIMLIIMAVLFISITSYLITFYFDVSGPMITMIALAIIFVIFKLYQYNKGDGEKEGDYMGEDQRIN